MFPLLANEPAVFNVSQPCLTAAEEHNAGGSQDNQACDQSQHTEANQLTVGDEDAPGVDCLLQGDLKQVSLRRSEKLVEGVSGEGIMLRGQCEHSMIHWPGADLCPLLHSTRGPFEPSRADATEGPVRLADARAPVAARRSSAGREAGGVVARETAESVLTGACESQAVARAVPAVEAGVRLTAVDRDLTKVSRKSRGTQAGRVS